MADQKPKLDKETEKIFTTGEHLKSMTETAGWNIAKEILLRKCASLLNIAALGTSLNAQNVLLEIGVRQETAKALIEWMKEIEGTVEQHKANKDAFNQVKDEYIIHVDDLKPTE